MSQPSTPPSALRAWLQLVRVPNLFTVPGDVFAGACFASACLGPGSLPSAFQLIVAALASVSVYAGGLIDNDLADLAEDAAERPDRPLPSGRISPRAAAAARSILWAIPLLTVVAGWMPRPWFAVQIGLMLTVIAYNRVKGQVPQLGYKLMGVCRGLNLLAGAALLYQMGGNNTVAALSFAWALYVAGLTRFASYETQRAPGPGRYWVLAPLAGLALLGVLPGLPLQARLALAAAGLAGLAGGFEALKQCPPGPDPRRVPMTVGRLVRLLVPMQALLCLSVGATGPALAMAGLLLACWILAARLGRLFYAS